MQLPLLSRTLHKGFQIFAKFSPCLKKYEKCCLWVLPSNRLQYFVNLDSSLVAHIRFVGPEKKPEQLVNQFVQYMYTESLLTLTLTADLLTLTLPAV
jgi:hypothetical protein